MLRYVVMFVLAIGLQSEVYAHQGPVKRSSQEKRLVPLIHRVARAHGVDHCLVYAVVKIESNFNRYAVSSEGARGLMQLMPGTQRYLGVRKAFDPIENLHGGTRYLAEQLRRFRSVRKALWAYHAGPGAVATRRVLRVSRRYADNVMRQYWGCKRRVNSYG